MVRDESRMHLRNRTIILKYHCGFADLDLAAFLVVSAVEGIGANLQSSQLDERMPVEIARLVTRYLKAPRSLAHPGSSDRSNVRTRPRITR